jgi:transposase InsO family protein
MIETQTGQKLIGIRSDRGTEFLNSEFEQLCRKNGIKHQLTNAYTPEQNGIAERMNRTLIEKARTMQLQGNTPAFLWSEAINTAAFLTNRSPASANEGVTPYQKFTCQIPSLSHLRIFGSKVFIYSKNKTTSKWDL